MTGTTTPPIEEEGFLFWSLVWLLVAVVAASKLLPKDFLGAGCKKIWKKRERDFCTPAEHLAL